MKLMPQIVLAVVTFTVFLMSVTLNIFSKRVAPVCYYGPQLRSQRLCLS